MDLIFDMLSKLCAKKRSYLYLLIPRFLWTLNGKALDTTRDVIQSLDAFSSSLSFTSLKREHSGNYTCEAINAASTDRFTAELTVNGKFLKAGTLIGVKDQFLTASNSQITFLNP